LKYCAESELKKARKEMKRKGFLELAMVKSIKNQLRDTYVSWKNAFGFLRYTYHVRNRKED
jgi:hypothetical protein